MQKLALDFGDLEVETFSLGGTQWDPSEAGEKKDDPSDHCGSTPCSEVCSEKCSKD